MTPDIDNSTKPRPTMREMIDRLKALNAPKAERVTVVGSDGLTADSINAPNAEVRILPDFMRQGDQDQALPDFMRQQAQIQEMEQRDELAPDQIAAMDEATRQEATLDVEPVEPITWTPDETAGETYPEVYDDAPIEYTANAPHIADQPALETTPELPQATPNVEGDIVYPAQQQAQEPPIAEILAETPAPANKPLAEEQALEATPEPPQPEQRSAPILWQDGEEYDPSLRRYFDLGSNPENARVQSASYFTRFEGAGLGDPITDAERGIVEQDPERPVSYMLINGEDMTREQLDAMDPNDVKTAEFSNVNDIAEINYANVQRLSVSGCDNVTSISAPTAGTVELTNNQSLETANAPNATDFTARGCDALTNANIPSAQHVDVSDCASIQQLNVPSAKTVIADNNASLTQINSPIAGDLMLADNPKLTNVQAQSADTIAATNCDALKAENVNAPTGAYQDAPATNIDQITAKIQNAEQPSQPATEQAPEMTMPVPERAPSRSYDYAMTP
jgi:hypothetical protein